MSEKPVQRRLAAIMFSDICGYSLIMGRDEAQAMRILARHDEIMNAAVATHDGHIIKRMGDGLLAEFHSAVAAVECAMAMQRAIAEKNLETPEADRFQVRIGVHLGDVVVSNGDILGDGVNVASRIEPLARPGGICISQDVYNQVHNKVEMQLVSLGPQQLKNIKRQVEIYRVLVAAADNEEAEAAVTAAPAPAPAPEASPSAAAPQSRRLGRWLLLAVIAVVALVAIAAFLRGAEGRRVAKAVRQADEFLGKEQGREARLVLEAAMQKTRPKAPGYMELEKRLAQARDMELTKLLRERFTALSLTLFKKDWDGAAQFATPESKMRLGVKNISGRMGMVGFLTGVLRLKPEDYRIRTLHFSDDRTKATVIPELRVNNNWLEQKASHWQYVDQQWWLVIE